MSPVKPFTHTLRTGSLILAACGGIILGKSAVGAPTSPAPPVSISLQQAIDAAERNEPAFAAARADQRVAALDRGNARAALLPSVVYHNQALYTQPNGVGNGAGQTGTQPAPIFIANNAVREYASQAVVNETLSVAGLAAVHSADAAAARASAALEVQRRGLVAATQNLFYSVAASEGRLRALDAARDESQSFLDLTRQREAAREAAHADVVKAELTLQQRMRDLSDAKLNLDRARLELGVLLFADPGSPFTTTVPSDPPAPPASAEVEADAHRGNPELAVALATVRQTNADVTAARAAYLPDLGLNFTYGIDASEFATNGPFDTTNNPPRKPKNLGYSLAATVDIPVWNWLSTSRHVKQTEALQDSARVALTAAQRRLIADVRESEAEAQEAYAQLDSLALSVRMAQDSLRVTRLRYASGEGTVLEVVDAETTLTGTEVAQEDGRMRYWQALGNLQLLTGTLR